MFANGPSGKALGAQAERGSGSMLRLELKPLFVESWPLHLQEKRSNEWQPLIRMSCTNIGG